MGRMTVVGGVLAVLFLVSACGGGNSPKQRLDKSLHMFNDGVRWKRVNTVTSYMSIPEADRYTKKQGDFSDDYRILDYEVKSLRLVPEDKAICVVRFSWLRLPTNIVQKTTIEQHWVTYEGEWKLKEQKVLRNGKAEKMPASAPF